ncbi:MAG: threonine ammonia-lyase, biosynthetic [Lentisphaeria bacterium]|nr:threonine ammonia-lyase, biosynthetic [Lentisphaeria bacterium]
MPPVDYLEHILNARVYDIAVETPLDPMPALSRRFENTILLKREDLQPVFSFKLRGAYNKMARLSPADLNRGVITASAGNHAQGVAMASQALGCAATIIMPVTTPAIKVDAVRARGATVMLHGDSYSDAYERARELSGERRLTFVHPYDDPDVIAGQGTVAMEILRGPIRPLHSIFVPVGGGGLIAGIAAYVKRLRPDIKIIGVEPTDADAMRRSLEAGKIIRLDQVGLFADGVAVKQVGTITFELCRDFVDEIITVTTDMMCAAIKDVFQDTRAILEPAGALALAGVKAYIEATGITGQNIVAVASGANMNFDRLRFVSEEAEMGEAREAALAVTIPEAPGSFKHFCGLIGARNITEFNYRYADTKHAHVFVGVQVADRGETQTLIETLRVNGLSVIDMTANDLAKLHTRHLVGGHAVGIKDEILYRFEFPERPGALMTFLDAMSDEWNISLFHYRNHGADYGRVLAGIQVPVAERDAFQVFLDTIGYRYYDETLNPAYQIFLS